MATLDEITRMERELDNALGCFRVAEPDGVPSSAYWDGYSDALAFTIAMLRGLGTKDDEIVRGFKRLDKRAEADAVAW